MYKSNSLNNIELTSTMLFDGDFSSLHGQNIFFKTSNGGFRWLQLTQKHCMFTRIYSSNQMENWTKIGEYKI